MENIPLSSYYDPQISFDHKRFKDFSFENITPHTHDALEILYLKKGSISYIIDEKIFEVEKDSLIITHPRKLHMINFNNRDIYDRYDFIFDEASVFPSIYKKVLKAPHIITCKNFPVFYDLFKKTDFYCKHFSGEELKNVLSHIIDEIAYNIATISDSGIEISGYHTNPTLAMVIEYIEKNLTKKLTLHEICGNLHISTSYLHNIFNECLNITPKKYINLKRLTLAQKLLQMGGESTKVYEKCGFSDYSVFYRSYKKHFGCSPSEELNKNAIRNIVY